MRRGEIWLLHLDPALGAEIKKTRPVVIVSDDAIGLLPLKVIVPVTEWKDRYTVAPWMVQIMPEAGNGLAKPSAVDTLDIIWIKKYICGRRGMARKKILFCVFRVFRRRFFGLAR